MNEIYESKPFRRSRAAYVAQCTLEYYISILSTDVFLAKLLKSIGCSDAFTGVLSSIVSFAFLFQLLSIPLAGKLKRVKKTVMLLDTASQILFSSIYLVPFLPLPFKGKAVAVAVLLIVAYFTLYVNNSIAYKWGNSFVSPEHRGSFSAGKEMISLLTGVLFTLSAGFLVDGFEAKNRLPQAFVFLGAVMLLVCAANFTCFSVMGDIPWRSAEEPLSFGAVQKRVISNRKFLHAVLLTASSEFSRFLVIGFLGTYKTEELGFSVGQVQLMNIAASLGRFAISKPLGSYSDRHSYAEGYFIGNLMTALSFLCGIFASPAARWLIVPCSAFYQMSFAGTNQNTFHLVYAFVDEDYIMPAIALNNSIRGVSGFCASLIGGRILSAIQKGGNLVFGRTVYGQQLLHVFAFMLIIFTLVYNRLVVCKQTEDRK